MTQKVARETLIIWLYSQKYMNQLKPYGLIHYVSKKMNYVIMYVDKEQADEKIELLENLHFVRSIERSPKRELSMNFEEPLDERRKFIEERKEEKNNDNYFKNLEN